MSTYHLLRTADKEREYRAYLELIKKHQIGCTFCELDHPVLADVNEVLYEYSTWFVMRNAFGYVNMKESLLVIPKRHITCVTEKSEQERDDFNLLEHDLFEQYPKGMMVVRGVENKDKSVPHLHYHFLLAYTRPKIDVNSLVIQRLTEEL